YLHKAMVDRMQVVADAAKYRPPALADAVLLDAPCTATGTLRRHPDGKWTKQPGDVATMAAVQARLLDAAIAMLKPGGMLVYCVCSMEAEEGPGQIDRLLAARADVRRAPVTATEMAGLEDAILSAGDVQTLPCMAGGMGGGMDGGMDGFFISRLVRV
ncbi:MAG: SAM-dependent methyltransferase, partial [Sphingomonadales bacterium]